MKQAPVFVSAYQLARWILAHAQLPAPLGPRLQDDALALLDHITLALHDAQPQPHLALADQRATLLGVHLRLAHDLGHLDARRLLFAAGELEQIGRQLGGWRRYERQQLPASTPPSSAPPQGDADEGTPQTSRGAAKPARRGASSRRR